jgi:hypothetical protein
LCGDVLSTEGAYPADRVVLRIRHTRGGELQLSEYNVEVSTKNRSNSRNRYFQEGWSSVTCCATDNTFVAFLVLRGHLLKTVWNPNLLAGDPKQTRAAAILSLLESTEDRIQEMLLKNSKTGKRMLKSFDLEPHSSNAPFPGGARDPQYRATPFPTYPDHYSSTLCSRVCLSSPLPLPNLKLTNTERRPLDLSPGVSSCCRRRGQSNRIRIPIRRLPAFFLRSLWSVGVSQDAEGERGYCYAYQRPYH